MVTDRQRDELCQLMDWLYANRSRVHYPPIVNGRIIRQQSIRHIRSVAQLKALVLSSSGAILDCSQTVTALLLAVGCDNPNGGDTDGFTGTLLRNLYHYGDPRHAYPGALAVFGAGTGHHVVMVRRRDGVHGNPLVFSQGQESDPRYLSLRSEAAGQPKPITMLSIAAL